MANDPSQKNNLLAQHPTVAAKVQAHYDQWWNGVAASVNDFSAITVGSDQENPCQLSPADWQDVFLDQGAQVRNGDKKNGPWNIVVDRDGDYEISLRRWPGEADAILSAGLPPFRHADGEFPPGKALPIAQARLKVADFDRTEAVTPEAKAAKFMTRLRAGRTQLQTWFYDHKGNELCGAYYVYVRRK